MQTTLELTSRSIRVALVRAGRVVDLVEVMAPEGVDPLDHLVAADLPGHLGEVRVVADHPDLLVRALIQPLCPDERMDRIVRFELQGSPGDEAPLLDWTTVHRDQDDCRLLALVAKPAVIGKLRAGLAAHGGTLAGLTHPAAVLAAAWRAAGPNPGETALVLDIGGARVHQALVADTASAHGLLYARSGGPGADELAKQLASARGVGMADARTILARMGASPPEDLVEMVRAAGSQAGAQAIAGERFAKTQLKLEQLAIDAVYLAGAGAQAPGFAEALAARVGKPVRPLNPFAGVALGLGGERLDAIAGLPSPWTVCLAGAAAPALALDIGAELARQRRRWWMTTGALRAGAVAAAVLAVAAIALTQMSAGAAADAIARLHGNGKDGLIPVAEKARVQVDAALQVNLSERDRLRWLAQERLPGRVAMELLTAIAGAQDPVERPVTLGSMRVHRRVDGVEVQLTGFAGSAGANTPPKVLAAFVAELRARMPSIAQVVPGPAPIEPGRHPFAYRIDVRLPDAP